MLPERQVWWKMTCFVLRLINIIDNAESSRLKMQMRNVRLYESVEEIKSGNQILLWILVGVQQSADMFCNGNT